MMRLLGELVLRTITVAVIGGAMLWGLYGLSFMLFALSATPQGSALRYILGGGVLVGFVTGALIKQRGTAERSRWNNAALGGFLALLVLSLCSIGPMWGAPVVTAQYGAVGGALTGLVVGLVNGLVLAVLTGFYHHPLARPNSYRRQVRVVSTTIGVVGSAIGIVLLDLVGMITPGQLPAQIFRLLLVPPPLIAGLFAWYASPWLADWYEGRSSRIGNLS